MTLWTIPENKRKPFLAAIEQASKMAETIELTAKNETLGIRAANCSAYFYAEIAIDATTAATNCYKTCTYTKGLLTSVKTLSPDGAICCELLPDLTLRMLVGTSSCELAGRRVPPLDPWSGKSGDAQTACAVNTGGLLRHLRSVSAAVSRDEAKDNMNGLLCELGDNAIRLVATDGSRLHKTEMSCSVKSTIAPVILPFDAVLRLESLLKIAAKDKTSLTLIGSLPGFFVFGTEVGALRIATRDANVFPPYLKVIPELYAFAFAFSCERATLVNALPKKGKDLTKLSLTPDNEDLLVENETPLGKTFSLVPATFMRCLSEERTWHFQACYLREALAGVSDPIVTLRLPSDPNHPMRIDSPDHVAVIMPFRKKVR